MYLARFQQNNSVIKQNDCVFKKDQLWNQFKFWQLVAKIANFAVIRQNKSVFTQKKKNYAF